MKPRAMTSVFAWAVALVGRLPRPLKRGLAVIYALMARPMTMGVRVMAFNREGAVCLVRHTYVSGWHLPGGAVERGETAMDAALKEAREEANLDCNDSLALFSIYKNETMSRFDHVVLFVSKGVHQTAPKAADAEIEEARFFPLDALPPGTTEPTRQRLQEVTDGINKREIW